MNTKPPESPRTAVAETWLRPTLVAWHLLGLTLVMVAPGLIEVGQALPGLPGATVPQVLNMGLAYAILALLTTPGRRTGESLVLRTAASVSAGTVCFGAAYAFLRLWPGVEYSPSMIIVASALGVPLSLGPIVLTRWAKPALATLALAAIAVVAFSASRVEGFVEDRGKGRLITSALHTIRVTVHSNLVQPPSALGGGLAIHGESFILVTGSGEFYRLDGDGQQLHSMPLPLTVPINRDTYLSDRNMSADPSFRVTGVLIDTIASPAQVLVSHHHWDEQARCLTLRVSTTDLVNLTEPSGLPSPGWKTVFVATPCLRFVEGAPLPNGSGGRMAWTDDGRLLLTMGDHQFDGTLGTDPIAQDTNSDYGKILVLDREGGRQVLSLGHRNPQGLLVTRAGEIWSTEHGPQGGDELNRIVSGNNYGWPSATYGTQYTLNYWPGQEERRNHGVFEEPAYSWVPSIGISDVIEIGAREFPAWQGDFLIASLIGQSLARVRFSRDRVRYVETIPIGKRVRDMEEAPDGRILLWTDEGDLVSLVEARLEEAGRVVYEQCTECHEGVEAIGPDLRGVYARRVASLSGFSYSGSLGAVGGLWAEWSLDDFLSDPSEFAPGTTMEFDGISDRQELRALIEFLKYYE